MKISISATVLIFLSGIFILQHSQSAPVEKIHANRDTIFLKKAVDSNDNTIYIEKNRHSAYYRRLVDFSIKGEDSVEYIQNRQSLVKIAKKGQRKYKLPGLPRYWLPVYKHNNHYYLYWPGDMGNLGKLMVTDSTICFLYMDGYDPRQILSAHKKERGEWRFSVLSVFGFKGPIAIHTVDSRTGLAVWENLDGGGVRYGLYVPAKNARNFDLIVNDGGYDKPDEFDFDKIDYKKLLNGPKH